MEELRYFSVTTIECLKDRGTAAAIHKLLDGAHKQNAGIGKTP